MLLDEEIHDEDESSHDSTDVKIPTGLILSSEDQKSMIDQVLLQIKKDEQCISKSFLKVLNNIKWDLIHIPGFTPDQLNKEFLTLIKPVKKTRTLTEVLNDFTLNSNKYLTDLADDYPKYPLTAFNLFCNVYREKIVKKLGDKLTLVS